MEKFDPITVEFLINSEDVKRSSKQVKDDLNSIGKTAEDTAKDVQISMEELWASQSSRYTRSKTQVETKIKEDAEAVVETFKQQGRQIEDNIEVTTRYGNSLANIVKGFRSGTSFGLTALQNNIPLVAKEIEILNKKNQELNASGKESVNVFQQLVKGLFSWSSVVSIGTTLLLVYGRQIIDWGVALFKGKDALDAVKRSQQSLNEAFSSNSYKTAIKDVMELTSYIKLAKEGLIDHEVAIHKYNETIGEVSKKVNTLAEAEQGLIDKAPAYVEAMLYKAAAAAASGSAADELAELALKQNETSLKIVEAEKNYKEALAKGVSQSNQAQGNFVNLAAATAQDNIKRTEAALNALKDDEKKLIETTGKVVDSLNTKAAAAAAAAGLNIFDKPTSKKEKAAVSNYQSLLDQLAALDKEYARKSFTKDEEELQALRDKFDKIRTLVQRFNADPKNKAKIIALDGLDKLEVSAIDNLTYRQTTDKLKIELDEQKKLFAEFEAYKTTFGKEAAEKEFADKIDVATNYYDFLKKKQKENEQAFTKVEEKTATGPETERVSLLNAAIKKETDEQKQLFNKQLAQLMDYQKKRLVLIENYEAQRAKLVAKGETDAVAELDKQHQEELDSLDDANVKKLASYKALFDGIVGLTYKESRIVLENAKAMLKLLEMSGETKAKILKEIAEVEKMLFSQKLDDVAKYADAIGKLGESFQSLGASFGSSGLSEGGAMLSGLSSGVNNFLNVIEAAKTKDYAGAISGGVNIIASIIDGIANGQRKNEEQARKYYQSVIGFQLQYNLSLQEQIRLQSMLNESVFLSNYEGRIKDALAAIVNANDKYQDAASQLAKVGLFQTKKFGFMDAPKDWLTKALEYPDLIKMTTDGLYEVDIALAQSLLDNGLAFGETTENILKNIIAWDEATQEAKEQIKEVISELSGRIGEDIKNDLVEAFKAGEDAAIKMGETIEKVLENVLANLIFNKIFQDTFDQLEKQMEASFAIGGDGTWTDDFAIFFANASKLTDDFNEAMKIAQKEASDMGFDIFKPDSGLADKKQGLAGAIRRELTEETGGELAGLFRGQFDITKRLLEGSEAHFEIERSHYTAMLDLVAINTKIESNTAATVAELQRAYEVLESIASNTRDSYLLDLNG